MIEYVPSESIWRTVNAKGYMAIHCLQVNRGYTRQGYGSLLLNECMQASDGMNGVVIVTSPKPWVNDMKFFTKQGFKKIAAAPPYFKLLVKQFKQSPLPEFNTGWEQRAAACGTGIAVFYSRQCPIIDYAIKNIKEAAKECGSMVTFRELSTAEEAQNAPSPYGTFCIIKDGVFLTHRIFSKERYAELFGNGFS